ncbi:MAG: sugar phosphate isomerase/epimerase [Candidatus Micrarchaeota archaeon]|nr:sugar phosphate isomerase/epimerase [Candidatus Micrarchaeota archaeon]
MPKYGLLTSAIYNVVDEVREFKRLGFDYAEIGIEEPRATPQIIIKQKRGILKALKEFDIGPVGHTSYWVNFGSSHEKVRRGWIEEGKDMISAAAALNIKFLNFHFHGGYGQTMQTKFGQELFVGNFTDSMVELSKFAKTKNLRLMLENVPPRKYGMPSLKGFSKVIEGTPGLMVHLDIPHAFIEGGMRGIAEYIDRFSDKVVHLHMHDNHGKQDEHLPLGKGSINFPKVAKLLKKIDYDSTITLEVFTSNKDAAKSAKYLKRIWEGN